MFFYIPGDKVSLDIDEFTEYLCNELKLSWHERDSSHYGCYNAVTSTDKFVAKIYGNEQAGHAVRIHSEDESMDESLVIESNNDLICNFLQRKDIQEKLSVKLWTGPVGY